MKIKISAEGARQKFEDWIANRGGVQIWDNVNLSDPHASDAYTPALTETGEPYINPSWRYRKGQVITDIDMFEFVTLREVDRLRVAVRVSGNGLMMKLTDGSTRKLNRRLEKHNTAHYRFDYETQEAVILKEVIC